MTTKRWRVVLDTNIFVAAHTSRNPRSPNKELIQRWLLGQYNLLYSKVLLKEVVDKLKEKRISQAMIIELVANFIRLAEQVEVPPEAVRKIIVADADDDHLLACAVSGKADYLITYDKHFDTLGGSYQHTQILEPLPFLFALRQHLQS